MSDRELGGEAPGLQETAPDCPNWRLLQRCHCRCGCRIRNPSCSHPPIREACRNRCKNGCCLVRRQGRFCP
ncbi:hypothetical protein LZ30DRAFT_743053 [Colletotrichum cereale]|nr:hypothetical protein LZ30DRAFT_743053 [Colletotrichum cereale]